MPFKVPVQSTPFSSRRFTSCLLIAATLGLPYCAVAQAQVSVGIGVPLKSETAPDPQAITTEELSKLIGGPTLVNFAASNVSAKEAIRALTTTVKGKPFFVNEQDGPLKTISVHWKDKPFWEAADQVEELADGRFLDSFGGPPSFWPYNRGRNQEIEPGLNGLLGAETPLVKLVASTLNRTSTSKILLRETEGAGAATTDEIELVMNAYFDPKLDVRSVQVRQLKFQSKPNTPVVDSSRSVKRVNGVFETVNSGSVGTPISRTHIFFPEGMAIAPKSRFFRVSGVLHTVIAATSETWKIPDLAAAGKVTRTIAGAQHSLEGVEIKNNQLMLKVTFPRPGDANVWPMQFMSGASKPLRVRDAQGQELQSTDFNISDDNGTIKSQVNFSLKTNTDENAVGPYSLEWTVPTQERSYDVPFEFRDVPMP